MPHILQSESQETKAEEAGKVKKEETVETEAVCLEACQVAVSHSDSVACRIPRQGSARAMPHLPDKAASRQGV